MFPFLVLRAVPIAKWIDSPSNGSNHDDLCPGLEVCLNLYHSTAGKFSLLTKPALTSIGEG